MTDDGTDYQTAKGDVVGGRDAPGRGEGEEEEEEDDGEWVKYLVEDLVYWRNPMHTALWLTVFVLVYFLVHISEYSLLTLLCYLILLQLMSVTGGIKFAPALKSMGLLRSNFDPKTFALQRQAFDSNDLLRFAHGTAMVAYEWNMSWNDALVTRDARKVLKVVGAGGALIVLGLLFSFEVVLLLLVMVLFSLPRIYESQQARIDETTQVLMERADPFLEKIYPILDVLKERMEPVIGTF